MATLPALPTATFRIDDNTSPGPGEGPLKIVRISDGFEFKFTLTLGGTVQALNEDNALADAVKRCEPFRGSETVIELNTTRDFSLQLGGSIANGFGSGKRHIAFWGSETSPTVAITDVTITKASGFLGKPVIKDVFFSRSYIATTGSNAYVQTKPGNIKFQDVELFRDADSFAPFRTNLGNSQRFGKLSFFDVDFDSGSEIGGYATKWNIRGAYAEWDFRNCDFTSAQEYYLYLDAIQGDSQILDCTDVNANSVVWTNTGNFRGAFQFVQRSSIQGTNSSGQQFFGGPPGNGDFLVQGNVFANCARGGGHAFRFTGHASGTITIENNTISSSHAGFVQFWSDPDKGIHTTDGQKFDTVPLNNNGLGDPVPCSGTAWVTAHVVVKDNSYFPTGSPTNNAKFVFEGVKLIEIGLNTAPAGWSGVPYWFYQFDNTNTGNPLDGPFENGEVRFLSAEIGSPISATHSGEVRYGGANNSSQTGTGSAFLNDAQIDALEDTNVAYGPWPQSVGSGAPAAWQAGTCVNADASNALVDPAVVRVVATDPTDVSVVGAPGELIASVRPAIITVVATEPDVQVGVIASVEAGVISVTATDTNVSLDSAGTINVITDPATVTVVATDPVDVQASPPRTVHIPPLPTDSIEERIERGTIVSRKSTF